jgi:hypothetical protein
MADLPAGPNSTVYNDWDEVVDSCRDTAYTLSYVCVENCSLEPNVVAARKTR